MITSLVLSVVVACTSLTSINVSVAKSQYLLDQTFVLSQGVVYRRWDQNLDKKADFMTVHIIAPEMLEEYKRAYQKGDKFNVEFFRRPTWYWIDVTGRDSWDRIYLDDQDNGQCTLYASKDTPT